MPGRRYAGPPVPGRLRSAAALGVAAVALTLLAGCTSNPVQPVPRPSATPGDAGTESPPPDPSAPVPVPTLADPITIPVEVPCEQLVTPDQARAYNPNLAVDPAYEPSPVAAQLVQWQGVACGWVDPTSGATVEVAVAHLSPPDIEAKKNELVLTTPSVPTYGGVDYFVNDGTVGEVNAFSGEYWILARSPAFFEPGDAAVLMGFVKGAVG